MGLSSSEIDEIKRAAELHDIGKVGVPDAILLNPSRLSPGEVAEIKRHPRKSGEIVSCLGFLRGIVPVIEGHHEHFDGSGYPNGLQGEEIPLGARILAVVDAYDAMTSNRAYRGAMSHDNAVAILKRGSGRQWDPYVVENLLDFFEDQCSRLQSDSLLEEDCA